ncbi:consortin [Erpetoichthys calabaricus]|nr:consortin [Erpetoichthys calabaricus]XP_028652763.2 consortin [Erpetoichthys calabaricus]
MDEEETQENKSMRQLNKAVDSDNNLESGSSHKTAQTSDVNKNQIQSLDTLSQLAQQDSDNNNEDSNAGETGTLMQCLKNENNCSVSSSANPEQLKENGSPSKSKKGSKMHLDTANTTSLDFIVNGSPVSFIPDDLEMPEKLKIETAKNSRPVDDMISVTKKPVDKDYSMLPHYLHQIAEAYFHEEDYEKAVQFIQLEKLYHEQLLSNLTAIQKQWELKWSTAATQEMKPHRKNPWTLGAEDLATLTNLCTTHQRPVVAAEKPSNPEKVLEISLIALKQTECQLCSKASICISDTLSNAATEEKQSSLKLPVMSEETSILKEGFTGLVLEDQEEGQTNELDSQQREALPLSGSLLAPHTHEDLRPDRQSLPASLLPVSTSCCSQPATEGEKILEDVLTATESSKKQNIKGEQWLDGAQLPEQANIFPGHLSSDLQTGGEEYDPSTSRTQAGQEYSNTSEKRTVLEVKDIIVTSLTNDLENIAARDEIQPDPEHMSREPKKLEVLLEQDWKSENELADGDHCPQEGFRELEENGTFEGDKEQSSFVFTEMMDLSDSLTSLDDLAKKIQIEEITPAEGLVSILKRRGSLDGTEILPVTVKRETKRRVRFQEPEDTLDQDEEGGGSCLLLVLLCIATVFISVGGTALYCTFGDVDSNVCTDFAKNMDFYFTQIQQGIEELRHWLSPGS